jgi:hypothetical protein
MSLKGSLNTNNEININDEWKNFMNTDYNEINMNSTPNYYDSDDDQDNNEEEFMNLKDNYEEKISANLEFEINSQTFDNSYIPKFSDIYISTKTKIAFLNMPIDLNKIFWEINVLKYMEPKNGVIKKQMKINSINVEEINYIKKKLENVHYYDEQIITSINNPEGRVKFKDIRKITIGISKKDILSYRSKKKSAFYNCFVLILRLKVQEIFKEFHVKIFNTGKLEIPGIQNDDVFIQILDLVIDILQPLVDKNIKYLNNNCETVLINSNFNCGFYINRDVLYEVLKYKYNIQCIYDSCTYPGIQCKFYYNPEIENNKQTGSQISKENMSVYKNVKEVSFMIFRTGSVLIVGKCDEYVLILIYEFLKNILINEYNLICQKNSNNDENKILQSAKDKKKKSRKKNILITVDVLQS